MLTAIRHIHILTNVLAMTDPQIWFTRPTGKTNRGRLQYHMPGLPIKTIENLGVEFTFEDPLRAQTRSISGTFLAYMKD